MIDAGFTAGGERKSAAAGAAELNDAGMAHAHHPRAARAGDLALTSRHPAHPAAFVHQRTLCSRHHASSLQEQQHAPLGTARSHEECKRGGCTSCGTATMRLGMRALEEQDEEVLLSVCWPEWRCCCRG